MDADSQKKIDKMIADMYHAHDVFDEPPKLKPDPLPENPPARWLVPEDKQVKCKTCGAEMDEHKLRFHWKERHWYAYRALQGRLNNMQRQREQEFRISSRPQKETWVDMSGLGRIER